MPPPEGNFVDHLEELRRRLLTALAAIGLSTAASYFFSGAILEFLTLPLRETVAGAETAPLPLFFQAPYDAFLARLKASLLAGVLLSSPAWFSQLWLFVAPGLYPKEKRVVLPLVFLCVALFFAGAAFAFWILLPLGLQFLLGFQTESLRPLLGIGPYFSFLIGMILACGVLFDLPVVVLGLVRMGVLRAETLRGARKGVIVLLLILAAVLTPSPDPASQILLAVPLLLLYEICVWVACWKTRDGSRTVPGFDGR